MFCNFYLSRLGSHYEIYGSVIEKAALGSARGATVVAIEIRGHEKERPVVRKVLQAGFLASAAENCCFVFP